MEANFKIDVSDLMSGLKELKQGVYVDNYKLVEFLGFKFIMRAKDYCPIRTGRLRDSIGNEGSGEGGFTITQTTDSVVAEIWTEVPYAIHVEYGIADGRVIRPKTTWGKLRWIDPGTGNIMYAIETHPSGFKGREYFHKAVIDIEQGFSNIIAEFMR